jgi:tol-pal system protein YbgF
LNVAVSSVRVGVAFATFLFFGALAPVAASAQSGSESGDPAALLIRIEKLEDELRAANGAIEELQNQQQRLQEQLKRFQEDVEFRLNGGAAPRISAAPGPAPAPVIAAAPSPPVEAGAVKPPRHADAFDPAADPGAAGAPRPLGTTQPSAPLEAAGPAPGAPLDLAHPGPASAPPPSGPLSPAEPPTVIAGINGQADGPKEQFNAAIEAYRAGQYEQAEGQFRAFLAHNAGSKLIPDATFYLGESYFQRSRPREAAEQYLKLSTDYAKSPRAPEGMLRLGQSLAMLGNNEQACATFSEVSRRFPAAASAVKKGVEREMQKDHC